MDVSQNQLFYFQPVKFLFKKTVVRPEVYFWKNYRKTFLCQTSKRKAPFTLKKNVSFNNMPTVLAHLFETKRQKSGNLKQIDDISYTKLLGFKSSQTRTQKTGSYYLQDIGCILMDRKICKN